MKLKKCLASFAFCALFSTSLSAAPILSDIVFVVDESGSMRTVQANL